MTDKQLEEYTRLKIEEATRELLKRNNLLADNLKDMESNIKEYKAVYNNLGHDKIFYFEKDDLTKELKESKELTSKLESDLEKSVESQKEINKALDRYIEIKKELEEYNISLQVSHAQNQLFILDTLFNRLKKAIRGTL